MYQAKFNPQLVLKPQDLVVLFRLSVQDGVPPTYAQLASELGLTASEIHAGIERASIAKLASKDKKGKPSVLLKPLYEFVIHGAQYAFPPVMGTVVKGLPTSLYAPPMIEFQANLEAQPHVWPDKKGTIKGITLHPLYPSVTEAAKRNPMLHELLALFDCIRSTDGDSRALAIRLLKDCWAV